jgi:hypothetical protein
VLGAWKNATQSQGCTLTLDPNDGSAAKGSLVATSVANGSAQLFKDFPAPPSSVFVRFWMKIASLDGVFYGGIFGCDADSHDFEIALANGKYTVHATAMDGTFLSEDIDKPPPTDNAWHRVDYALEFGAQGSVRVGVDSATIYTKQLNLGPPPSTLHVRFGAADNTFTVHLDDFVVSRSSLP